MDISMASLHRDGRPCGALVRRRSPREVRTFVAERRPDGTLHHLTTEVALPGDGSLAGWTHVRSHGSDGESEVARTDVDAPEGSIPASLLTCALDDMLAHSATDDEGHVLDLVGPDRTARHAHLSVGNPQILRFPDGREEELGVVDLFLDGETRGRFWFDSEHVVASEQDGRTAYRVDGVDALVHGLDDELAEVVRAHCR